MLQWWLNRPSWLRQTIGWIILIFGIVTIVVPIFSDHPTLSRTGRGGAGGFVFVGLGLALVVLGGKSDAEKNRYHF